MLKQLTFKGKLSAGNPHKEYWWSVSHLERLQLANNLILQIFQIHDWKKHPLQKRLTGVRKLRKND
jgi:NDP-sugar pyrophosphorylase family protein